MCVANIVTGELPASRTHAARRWTFTPSADLSQPALGTVVIVQGKREIAAYGVDLEDIGRGCHHVLFAKQDDAADVYAVTTNPAGKAVDCTCTGYGRHRTCKHCDVTAALIAEDVIPLADVHPAVLFTLTCSADLQGGF